MSLIQQAAQQMAKDGVTYDQAVTMILRSYLIEALRIAQWNQCRLADNIGCHRNTVQRLLHKCGITHQEIRGVKFYRYKNRKQESSE